jgi:hypothetical protein
LLAVRVNGWPLAGGSKQRAHLLIDERMRTCRTVAIDVLESQRASERSDVVPGPFEVSFGRHTPVAVLCFSVAGSRASWDVPRRPLEPTTQPRRTFRHAKDSVPEALRPQSNGAIEP